MTEPETPLDPSLARLIAAPWSRLRYLERIRSLLRRYELLIAADASADPADRGRLELELLRDHPSALLERASVDRDTIERRLALARDEEMRLRAAAPIPAPVERTERTTALAFADVEWLMRELRPLRRNLRRRIPAELLREAEARPDPLPELDADLLRAIGAIRRATLLRTACAIAGARHGVPDLRRLLAPERTKPAGSRVVVCQAHQLREGVGRRVEAFGRTIAVFVDQGELRAIDDACPHRGGPLSAGDLDKGAVICPLHGWAFDLATGKMRGNSRVTVPTYEIACEGDDIVLGPRKGPAK